MRTTRSPAPSPQPPTPARRAALVAARGAVVLLLLAAGAASGAAPALAELDPRGAQRGKAFTLTLSGTGLAEGAAILSTLPASFAPLAPKEGRAPDTTLSFLVELGPEAAVGLYPVRVRTPEGLSNILLFSVGALPEIAEAESEAGMQEYSNDSALTAQPIQAPVTVNGKLRGPDQDFYRFRAAQGQRLVLEVEARRAGSAVDPLLRLLDAAGKELARNDDADGLGVDARLDVAFPAGGDYFVAVQDSKFSAQGQNFYRLKVGSFAYADGLFPLGWKRGAEVEVELFGGNLPAAAKVRPEWKAGNGYARFSQVSAPGSPGGLPFLFALGDRPETLEPERTEDGLAALPPGTVVNGRIAQSGEVDRYRLAVSPGEHWTIDLQGASLGTSRLYAVLTVYDLNGRKLTSAGDAGRDPDESFVVSADDTLVDPYLAFKAPPGVRQVVVTVEDLLGRGGPNFGYRLVAERQPPGFNLRVSSPFVNIPGQGSAQVVVVAERRGYMGPIRLSIPGAPDDLLLEGGHIPAEGGGQTRIRLSRTGYLTVTPKPGAKTRTLDLTVWGEGITDTGEIIRRRAYGPGMITQVRGAGQKAVLAPWLDLELPAMVVKERPAALEVVSPRYVKLVQGRDYDVQWKFVRRNPAIRPPNRVNGDNVPGVGNLRVIQDRTRMGAEAGSLKLITTVGTPPIKFDMMLSATVNIDGRDETITAPAVTFDVVEGYAIPAPAPAVIAPGGKGELTGRVVRQPDFPAAITVKADNLPLHVSCREAEVAAGAEQFRMACEAGAAAAPGEYAIELLSASTLAARDKENVPYTIPPVKASLRIER